MKDDESMELDPDLIERQSKDRMSAMAASSSSSSSPASTGRRFAALSAMQMSGGKVEKRVVRIPAHRFTPLKDQWMKIYTPLVEHMKLQVRVLAAQHKIEVRTSAETEMASAIQKAEDFLRAFMLGFEVRDALALLRLDDLYIESFEVTDVKRLQGDNLARAIGRVSGKDGRTKYAIENATRTRIVLADRKIHILGSYKNILVARRAICDLILGSPPGKVYGRLKILASRSTNRY
jgi:RNA-binding protein PNO1